MEHRMYRIFANGETAGIPHGLHGELAQSVPMAGIRYLLMINSIADKQSDGRKYELYFGAVNQYGLHGVVRNAGSP